MWAGWCRSLSGGQRVPRSRVSVPHVGLLCCVSPPLQPAPRARGVPCASGLTLGRAHFLPPRSPFPGPSRCCLFLALLPACFGSCCRWHWSGLAGCSLPRPVGPSTEAADAAAAPAAQQAGAPTAQQTAAPTADPSMHVPAPLVLSLPLHRTHIHTTHINPAWQAVGVRFCQEPYCIHINTTQGVASPKKKWGS